MIVGNEEAKGVGFGILVTGTKLANGGDDGCEVVDELPVAVGSDVF